MSEQKVIEIEVWGIDGEILMAHGHHDEVAFFQAALAKHREWVGGKDSEDFAEAFSADDVQLTWWKPDPEGAAGHGGSVDEDWFISAKPADENAFPVTLIRED